LSNTTDIVRTTIERDGALRNNLARGLINIRALARFIQRAMNEQGQQPSLDAIINAIRRYPVKESTIAHQNTAKLLKKLTMKNKIVDVAIINGPEIAAALGKFASQIDYSRGETFRIVSGVESIRVVVDEKNGGKLTETVPKKSVRKIVRNLAEIIVSLSEIAEGTPGVVSTVTTELAIHAINMIEFMSCVPELIIVVDEKDALKSYDALDTLSKEVSYPLPP
jgi:aspartokinase